MSALHKLRFILVSLLMLAASSCAPRGETDTLDGVLATSKKNFSASASQIGDEGLKAEIKTLSESLEKMVGQGADSNLISTNSSSVVNELSGLVRRAGYTSRAAMDEITMQYRMLGADAQKGGVNSARVKLLVARTYSLLASELDSTKFSLG